ncbi:MAG: aminopeptidase P family protein [Rhodospirillaceae bacterium]|nr:aminopeptidase P family protein [Rhodospirillaceae bacterium]MBT6510950.1 aminopeptidase P family protein [Rhodospirillaceae bacterium]MBT7612020.1 aminopeptidase P family protein [Rhodospirillaceae bacterium]MBT7647429.1 aminopeptidase P family protein [Rhodospirillaceae bacterium]
MAFEEARKSLAALPAVNVERMRLERLQRLQNELQARDLGAMLLYDPVNVRYATDCRSMQIWTMHNSARYCLVPADGKAIMFDFLNSENLSDGLETIGETRPGTLWFSHAAGPRRASLIEKWADELASLIRERCGNNRIIIDRLDADGRSALERRGIDVGFGQDVIEQARRIKTVDEQKAQAHSALVCETALKNMHEQTEPGVSENELWATLVHVNAALGGDYIETRLVVSGTKTNPWLSEASERQIQAGELLGIDTDMVGPCGYNTDISRTWLCHPGKPSKEQKTLYKLSFEQIHHNMWLLRAGLSFREFSQRSWKVPERYSERDFGVLPHGIGMCNEYPVVPAPHLFNQAVYDGHFEENMTVSLESYIAEAGTKNGVKLEEMVRITATGTELVAAYPFEDELLAD